MTWTDDHIELLLQAFQAGDSASVIAAALSTAYQRVTRNAVIGRLYRMGLRREERTPVAQTAKKSHPKHRPARREKFSPHRRLAEPPPKPEPIVEINCDDIPIEQRKQLLELENWHCRFPCGMPGRASFFFCGHPSADLANGFPYCADHTRIVKG